MLCFDHFLFEKTLEMNKNVCAIFLIEFRLKGIVTISREKICEEEYLDQIQILLAYETGIVLND